MREIGMPKRTNPGRPMETYIRVKTRSPHNLVQERVKNNPWKMCIYCILLNKTNYKQVSQVEKKFFRVWPNPKRTIGADREEMRELLRPLGFYNKRVDTIIKFSEQYKKRNWEDIGELYGIGKYARDSWAIFQENKIPENVTDKKLVKYIEWIKEIKTNKKKDEHTNKV